LPWHLCRGKSFDHYSFAQIEELMDNYKPDLIWFDGDWEQSAEKWQAKKNRELLLQKNPNVIINSHL